MTRLWRFAALVLFFTAVAGCEDGDWLGPVERGLRASVNGWDMWQTEAEGPFEGLMPPAVPGTVPTVDTTSYEAGAKELAAMPADKRKSRAPLVYRRFCHHCHGPNGDGRIIVGESLEIKPADLRGKYVQSKSDKEIFDHVKSGGKLMVPFAETISPADILLCVDHLRTLKNRKTRPYYPLGDSEPIR